MCFVVPSHTHITAVRYYRISVELGHLHSYNAFTVSQVTLSVVSSARAAFRDTTAPCTSAAELALRWLRARSDAARTLPASCCFAKSKRRGRHVPRASFHSTCNGVIMRKCYLLIAKDASCSTGHCYKMLFTNAAVHGMMPSGCTFGKCPNLVSELSAPTCPPTSFTSSACCMCGGERDTTASPNSFWNHL